MNSHQNLCCSHCRKRVTCVSVFLPRPPYHIELSISAHTMTQSTTSSESAFTTNDGIRLIYEHRSPSTASPTSSHPTIVLIHGWSGSSQAFVRNFDALSRDFPVIRYDQRGHGDSDASAHGLRVSRLSMDLYELLSHLHDRGAVSEKGVVLVGCSLGSAVIWSFVEQFGLKSLSIRGCVFVDQAPFQQYSADGSWTLGSNGLFSDSALETFCTQLLAFPEQAHRGTVHACLTREPTPEEVAFFAGEAAKARPDVLANLMRDHNKNDWRMTTALVTCRTMVVVGGASKIFPPEGVRAAAELMPDVVVEELESGSHWVYYEEAEWFNAKLAGFVRGIGTEREGEGEKQ